MKLLRYISLIVLSGWALCYAGAKEYSLYDSMSASCLPMQTTSAYKLSAYQGNTSVLGAEVPTFIPSSTGDLDPFGASSASPAIRKAPPGTGGDKDNPSMEGPLTDGTWMLLLMAMAATLTIRLRQGRVLKRETTKSNKN